MAWFVIRTNIKCEDKAERNLDAAGYRTYAPWQRFETYNRRKRVFIEHSLRVAPRYLFLETDQERDGVPWGIIRACEGVERVLGVDGLPQSLTGDEESALYAIMAAEANFEFDETRAGKLHRREIGKTKAETTKLKYPVGSKILVTKGPFAAFKGQVVNVNGRGQVEALISLLGGRVPVEIPVDSIELLAFSGKAA